MRELADGTALAANATDSDFVPTQPLPLPGMPTSVLPAGESVLEVRFAGSGGEYFRIWVVNLLLLFVTLGLYYPWARVRRLKYFYNHTLVDGHGLDFHGEPRRMVRGMLIVGAFLLVYGIASQKAAFAGVVAAVAACVLWPLIWRQALRFRLGHTSWRGLRFGFAGDLRGAVLGSGLPLALLLVPLALLQWQAVGLDEGDPRADLLQGAMGGLFLVWALAFPWFFWYGKRYLHGGLRFAQLALELRIGPAKVYGAFLMAGLVAVAVGALAFGGVFLLIAAGFLVRGLGGVAGGVAIALGAVLGYLLLFVAVRAFLVARLQNLLWSNTGARWLRFRSELSFWAVLRRLAANWLLVVLTLGLYWPFAAVALWRLRAEAIEVVTAVEADQLVDRLGRAQHSATGDLAADLAGFDLGW